MTKPSRPVRKPYRPAARTSGERCAISTDAARKNKSEPTGEKTKLGGPG